MLSPTINSLFSGKRLMMLSSCSRCILLEYRLHRCQQIFRNELWLNLPRSALIFPLATAVTAQHKRRVQSRITRELDVAITIANHLASFEIDFEIRGCALDQAGLRFTAVAV